MTPCVPSTIDDLPPPFPTLGGVSRMRITKTHVLLKKKKKKHYLDMCRLCKS